MGAKVGYIRVSSVDQNTDRQLEGVTLDKTFEDKVSGSTIKRPGLQACLDYLREGDVLHVHSIDRLARNLVDLEGIVRTLNSRGVEVRFIKENLVFNGDTNNPMNKLMFQLLGAVAEFERSMIRERQKEGIAAAKAKGKHLGRTSSLSPEKVADLKLRVAKGESKKDLAVEFEVSRQTIFNHLKKA